MGLPVIVEDGTGAIQCPHGGIFKFTATSNVTDTAGDVIIALNTIVPGSAPCPGIPPAIPPCVYPPAIGSGSKKLYITFPTVTFANIQISASNGFPHLIYLLIADKVTTL